jgi:hypothetical protein
MPRFHFVLFATIGLVLVTSACARKKDTAPPVASLTLTLARPAVEIGSPVDMKYRFAVAPRAPAFGEDYWVFVHFLDSDGELMWTDDHQPPTPTRQWKPGATIEYMRTMFVPRFPYVGNTTVEVGLFSPRTGQRLPMSGETRGQRSYRVVTFALRPQADNWLVVFKDGWHMTETPDDGSGQEWQWSKGESTLSFKNPRRDALFYLQLDRPVAAFPEPQHVDVLVGDAVIDSFDLAAHQPMLRKVPLKAEQFGADNRVEMRIRVDRTFVPATIPELKNRDSRQLGVRVFRAYLEPK